MRATTRNQSLAFSSIDFCRISSRTFFPRNWNYLTRIEFDCAALDFGQIAVAGAKRSAGSHIFPEPGDKLELLIWRKRLSGDKSLVYIGRGTRAASFYS
jgi:hypothetical protein